MTHTFGNYVCAQCGNSVHEVNVVVDYGTILIRPGSVLCTAHEPPVEMQLVEAAEGDDAGHS